MACPIPRDAPVTMAILPVTSKGVVIQHLHESYSVFERVFRNIQ
jgi:hypothetical protein